MTIVNSVAPSPILCFHCGNIQIAKGELCYEIDHSPAGGVYYIAVAHKNLWLETADPITDTTYKRSKGIFEVLEKDMSGRVVRSTTYSVDNGDGTYSQKVDNMIRTYSGDSIISEAVQEFDIDGAVKKTITRNFFTNDDGAVVIKEAIS